MAAAVGAAYARTFSVPFVFDDLPAILENSSLRHWSTALFPPDASTTGGRPFLNLSLAFNYAIGGTSVAGYHALNLAIHTLAGFVLFGLIRRTVRRTTPHSADAVAFSTSLLWLLHPLQTEAVTYIVQRAESLMGLLYLSTLYFFVRGADPSATRRALWLSLSVGACMLGMATKEVMVSAPLVALLYDRTFLSGTFRRALQRHWPAYAGLAGTWLLLAALVASSHNRGGSAGFGVGIAWWRYLAAQAPAVTHYLRLALWPAPLVFDYGTGLAAPTLGLLPPALLILGLAAATLWALRAHPESGFLGACFFLVLAPSSSFVPIATEPMAEHRMYLASIPCILGFVLLLQAALGRFLLAGVAAVALALGTATFFRNLAYSSEESIWADAAAKLPENPRAINNLGAVLAKQPGRSEEAMRLYRRAIALQPDFADPYSNLATALSKVKGHSDETLSLFRQAIRLNPRFAEAHYNLGLYWAGLPGHAADAVQELREALRLRPDDASTHNELGTALLAIAGHGHEAIEEYREALRLDPELADAHYNLATALLRTPGGTEEAVRHYEDALSINPNLALAHNNLGIALAHLPGRDAEAISHYRASIRLDQGNADSHYNLATVLARYPARLGEAVEEYKEALRLKPDFAAAHNDLANALCMMGGHSDEAVREFLEAIRIRPDFADAHFNLANALTGVPGREDEVVAHLEDALRIRPDDPEAHVLLARALGTRPGARGEVIAHLEAALRLQPANESARAMLEQVTHGK